MSKVLISGDRANAAKLAAGEWCQAAVFAGLLGQRLRDYKTLLLSFFKPPYCVARVPTAKQRRTQATNATHVDLLRLISDPLY